MTKTGEKHSAASSSCYTWIPTLCIVISYGSAAFWLSCRKAFWSPDSGARFAMIRNWVRHGQIVNTYYPSVTQDPTGQIHPLTFFLFHRAHSFCAMYPPLFPALTGVAYRAFGFDGLLLLPLLCGLGTLWVMHRVAWHLDLCFPLLFLLAFSLSTPLLLYSVVFWDHSAQMLIASLTVFWTMRAVQVNSFRAAIIAGATLGIGVWVHELFFALFIAVWLAATPYLKGRRHIFVGLPIGFVLVVSVWTIFNSVIYSNFAGPHLSANVLQNNVDHPFSLALSVNRTQLVERAMQQLVGTTVFNTQSNIFPYYLVFICLLLMCIFVGWIAGRTIYALPVLTLFASGLAIWLLLRSHGATEGLFLATPLLIPALAVPWHSRRYDISSSLNSVFYAWMSRTCGLFILFVLVSPITPGIDWGSRYLLAALPILVLLAARSLEIQYQQIVGSWRRMMIFSTISVMFVSLSCQISGLLWVNRCFVYNQILNNQIHNIHAPILVTDTNINAQLVDDTPLSQARFCVRSDNDVEILASILSHRQYHEFAFVGTEYGEPGLENALAKANISCTKRDDRPLWNVDTSHEEGPYLRYTLYIATLKVPETQEHYGRAER